jgi:hypothetical protein
MRKSIYYSIFLFSLTTLALENTLTRIFSVTMWYHYAFMAISVAMLGMSTGAVKVYYSDFAKLSEEKINEKIALYGRFFSLFTIISLFTLLSVPFVPRNTGIGFYTVAFIYMTAAVPFYFSGVAVALILATRYIHKANALYASDLTGAAVGSILFFIMLSITDAISFVIFLASLGLVCAYMISRKKSDVFLAGLVIFLALFNHYTGYFQIEWTKVDEGVETAKIERDLDWEKWTPFSRLTVTDADDNAFGWGISTKMMGLYPDYRVSQKNLTIDSAAATVITGRDHPVSALIHLSYDITNMAHYLVSDARVGIIGVGGGRDILSALHFGQKEVWGVEINGQILHAARNVYRDFTYPFDEYENVFMVEDEARSFFERTEMEFDIIQASLIDSWAATAAGAFVLTENSLYTVEGWKVFFSKLSNKGVLTMSRWHYPFRPGEMLRLLNLAYVTLEQSGIKDPSKHILLTTVNYFDDSTPLEEHFGAGTIVVSKEPFKQNIVDRFTTYCETFGFDPVLTAEKEGESVFHELIDPETRDLFVKTYPLDISAPTDNNPFFFNMLKPTALLTHKNIESMGPLSTNLLAIKNLLSLLLIVTLLAVFLIIVPLLIKMRGNSTSSFLNRHTAYFSSIGTGFMLIEIALIQKFAIFLGHPTYSILVVLFTVLLFCGVGSFFSSRIYDKIGIKGMFILIIAAVAVTGSSNMFILPLFSSWTLFARIIYAFFIMAITGFMLGMPFPTGLRLLGKKYSHIAPWLWGVNGATSVVSTVLAISVSIFYGISTTFFLGLVFYIVAFISGVFIDRLYKKDESN